MCTATHPIRFTPVEKSDLENDPKQKNAMILMSRIYTRIIELSSHSQLFFAPINSLFYKMDEESATKKIDAEKSRGRHQLWSLLDISGKSAGVVAKAVGLPESTAQLTEIISSVPKPFVDTYIQSKTAHITRADTTKTHIQTANQQSDEVHRSLRDLAELVARTCPEMLTSFAQCLWRR